MEYNFKEIEPRVARRWQENKTYKVERPTRRGPKFYVLDMFPYPSGAGLHVCHPLGYIASDIYSRYKRQKGFNVLHPMGYDAFGLPAEQYAIQTGQHPAVTTERNIARYREQLDKIGFSFDWDREVRTCDPAYYKWTQWAFLKMFGSYYCYDKQQARPIEELTAAFEQGGTQGLNVAYTQELHFTTRRMARAMPEEEEQTLHGYRLAFRRNLIVQLVPGAGNRARQRRSARRAFGARRPSGRAETDETVASARDGLRPAHARRAGQARMERLFEDPAQLDRPFGGGPRSSST